jgi:hypothetical protein
MELRYTSSDTRKGVVNHNHHKGKAMYAKPLQFEDITDFAELTDQAEKWVHKEHCGKCQTDPRNNHRGTIYCSIRQNDDCPVNELPFSMRLTLAEESPIAQTIETMCRIVSDTFFVNIVIHDDGNSLVIVKYNSIIGSRYVAAVRTKTIMPVIRASLERQTRDELRRRAKVAEVSGRGSMNKQELISALVAEMAGE